LKEEGMRGDGECVKERGRRRWDPEGGTGEEGKPIGCGLLHHKTVDVILQQPHSVDLHPLSRP